jgi:hypothetical protein
MAGTINLMFNAINPFFADHFGPKFDPTFNITVRPRKIKNCQEVFTVTATATPCKHYFFVILDFHTSGSYPIV